MGRRGWTILIVVVAIAAMAGVAVAVFAIQGQPSAVISPSATTSPTATEPPPSEPSRSLSPEGLPVDATCDTISTADFQQLMGQNGWVSWETQELQIGVQPFARFPDGSPAGAIVCRWGVSPELATDNVVDLAWTPIGMDAAASAQEHLAAEGYRRIDSDEGVYFALTGAGDWADAEGYGETYLFTTDDVRWAHTKADLAYVKAPDEDG